VLIPTLILGLNSKYPYVQEQLINFFSLNIPIFSDLFSQKMLEEKIWDIIVAYLALLKKSHQESIDYDEKNYNSMIVVLEGIQKVSHINIIIKSLKYLSLTPDRSSVFSLVTTQSNPKTPEC
jgi:hypothetical protein